MMNPVVQRTSVTVNNWSKGLRAGNFRVPQKAVVYDVIEGISPKKGKFIIYQFKDELGKVIKSCHLYFNKGVKSFIRNFEWGKCGNVHIRESQYQNGEEKGFKGTFFWRNNEKGYTRILEEKTIDDGYLHTFKYVKPNEKPQGIHYKYKGYNPCFAWASIGSKNIAGGVQNLHLLPAVISSICTSKNTDAVIETIYNYEQGKLGIKGILEPIFRFSMKELNPEIDFALKEKERIAKGEKYIDTSDMCEGGYQPFTKKIAIYKGDKDLIHLMNVIAHECQHAQDAVMMACLEDFDYTKIIKIFPSISKKEIQEFMSLARKKYGIIRKDDPRYDEYRKMYDAVFDYNKITCKEEWEKSPVESKSIPYGNSAKERFRTLILDLDKKFAE